MGRTVWGSESFGYIEAGLPNITGSFTYARAYGQQDIDSGAISTSEIIAGGWGTGSYSWSNRKATLNASWSSSIYGKSKTVQPPAVGLKVKTRFK